MDDGELPAVIGLYSPEARSGKGTVARVLVDEFGYTERQFSAPIKAAWTGLLESIGCGDLVAATLEGPLKETALPRVGGLSFRKFAEHIGDGLRGDNPDLWIKIISEQLGVDAFAGRRVVLSDLRYPNEFTLIKTVGGSCVRVERADGYTRGFKQPSEGRLDNHDFDYTLKAHSPEELELLVRAMFMRLM
jgi:hypothetical protein